MRADGDLCDTVVHGRRGAAGQVDGLVARFDAPFDRGTGDGIAGGFVFGRDEHDFDAGTSFKGDVDVGGHGGQQKGRPSFGRFFAGILAGILAAGIVLAGVVFGLTSGVIAA